MTEAEMLIDVLLDQSATDVSYTGVLVEVDAKVVAGVATEIVRVTVEFPAGRHNCQFAGALRQELLTHPAGPQAMVGAKVLVLAGVALGVIYPRGS